MNSKMLLFTIFSVCIAMQSTQAVVQPNDITNLFEAFRTSQGDSGFGTINSILIRYKSSKDDMKEVLRSRATFNGVANTTLLHAAVRGNNIGLTAIMFQKASILAGEYQAFAREMANALDGNNLKPMDYAVQLNNQSIINVLRTFTDSGTSSSTGTSSSGASTSSGSSYSTSGSSSGTSAGSSSSGATSSTANLQTDIVNLFNAISNSNFSQVRSIIIAYKNSAANMKSLLEATKTVNGIDMTTSLHVAAQKNDISSAGFIISKSSIVNPISPNFGATLANKIDGAGKKPIDYVADQSSALYNFLRGLTAAASGSSSSSGPGN